MVQLSSLEMLALHLEKGYNSLKKGFLIQMPYDELLTERIRQAFAHLSSVKEQKMFGGISFLVNGKLCVGAYNSGDMILRCDPEMTHELLTKKGARQAEMKGKPMTRGWLLISPEGTTSHEDLDYWIGIALDFNQKIS